ncbi:hypothetical protein NQ314_005973, partial [Rhamnusium bicolor]
KKKQLYEMGQMSYIGQLDWVAKFGYIYTENVLRVKEVQELLKSNEKFDIVVLEHFFNEAMMIFAHKFNCPLVLLAPGPTTVFNNHLFANPSPPSYVPGLLADFGTHMTFWERLKNTYYDIAGELFVNYVMLPKQEEILKRTVPDAPDLKDILYNSSLLLLTSHISLKDPVPLQPAIKEIGGYHVQPPKPLPKDLQEFLDNAKEGKKEAILKVFSKLKHKVLWKFEADLPEKPKNVEIMSWLPQQDILAHPNVIAFITHAGLLGTIEAIYHGVPLLGLPIFWDQEKNIEDAVRKGYGLKIPFQQLNEENFGYITTFIISQDKIARTMKLKLFFLLFAICAVEPAKILGIFPTPAASHFTLGFRLMKELADRGHEVTVVNPFPQKTPINNYTDIPVESMNDALFEYMPNNQYVVLEFKKDFWARDAMCFAEKIKFLHNMAYKLTEKLVSHENFQKLLNSDAEFDLIIIEYFLNEASLGLGKFFDAPVVLFSTLPSSTLTNHLFANPGPSSYVPNLLTQYTGDMDFWQRFSNLAYNTFDNFYKHYYMLPLHDHLLKTYISKDLNVEDVIYNASLILLNSHPSISEPVPHTPNMIEIGGFHINSPKALPLKLQEFMDEANEGVVLFSMGSNLNSLDLDPDKRDAILKAFSRIKQKVLWKFEDDFTIETVYHGVPIIGIPIYGDQKLNIARAVKNGYAVSVPLQELTEEKLSWALNEVLNNTEYANNVKTHSKIMKDQIVTPLDSAVYWIEYVIRHNGTRHLQSAGLHLTWFKRNLIDIIIVLVVIDLALFLIFYYIIKHIIHYLMKFVRKRENKKYERLST